MAYSINTNVTSLQAQEYLRTSSEFQSKTINRVTSGLRIVSSGDDAAGLAIANSLRSDRSVLSQGIRNANDGLSTLQTIDGGINNISQLLDRARTLAAQSASGTFEGNRKVLNSEFQSVVSEIDRQAQAIGLDQGGSFAKNLTVFIGGGRSNSGVTEIENGSVSVDLSQSTVDAKSLGLKGVQAVGTGDIGTGSVTTSVEAILSDSENVADLTTANYTQFKFYGPGFGDGNGVSINVNTQGVTDTDTLVTAINAAIDSAGNGGSTAATAFKNAGVVASVNTASDGTKQLAFSSSSTAFQVKAGDKMANALMGNFGTAADGADMETKVTGDVATAAAATTFGAVGAGDIVFRFQGAGMDTPLDITVTVAAGDDVSDAINNLSSQVVNNSTLNAAGISLTGITAGAALEFTSTRGEKFDVQVTGDVQNRLGMGSFQAGDTGEFDYTTKSATFNDGATGNANFEFSINGGASDSNKITFAHTNGTTDADDLVSYMNEQFNLDSEMKAAGLKAVNNAGTVTISSDNNTSFRMSTYSGTTDLGFGDDGATFAGNTATAAPGTAAQFVAGGSQSTADLDFGTLAYGSDDQTITISSNDNAGVTQAKTIVLRNDDEGRSGRNIDETLHKINSELQQTNNPTLQKIVAVKVNDAGTEKIQFLSSDSFQVSVGKTASGNGVGDTAAQGQVDKSEALDGGSVAAIDTQAGGSAAVSALADAVKALGEAQAVVGKGQNRFNFAVSLASTQLSNLAASESRIRDADLAMEAANLTKASILQQAGIAALAQANSAPQGVLSLLRG